MSGIVYLLGTVIVLGLVYLCIVMRKYSKVVEDNQPQLKLLKAQIEKLTEGLASETHLARAAREKVEERKVQISQIKMEISNVDKEIAEEKQHEEQIEMKRIKKQFRKSRD